MSESRGEQQVDAGLRSTGALTAYRWNGEYWYEDEGLLIRARKWVAWFGGWEAHSPKRPWAAPWTLRQRLGMLTPISFFGHRVTFYGWGAQVRLRGGSLVWTKGQLFFSPDGTPQSATIWFRGAPPEVIAAARKSAEERAAFEEHARHVNTSTPQKDHA